MQIHKEFIKIQRNDAKSNIEEITWKFFKNSLKFKESSKNSKKINEIYNNSQRIL